MPLRERLYEAAILAARPLLRAAAPLDPRLRRGVEARRGAVRVLADWAARERDPARPLVWVHAPSVGEALMAQAIIGSLRELRAEVQVAFTFFSPSAERVAARVGADVSGYLPWDTAGPVRRALDALRPAAVAYVRTEVWPVLGREAARRGAALALVNAVLPESSSRLRPASRFLLGPAYRRLDAVGAVTEAHARRFSRLGVAPERVRTTGDARFDQVWARVRAGGANGALVERVRDPAVVTLVAGSTWGADEARLVPAFARARSTRPMRLVVAPHEPDEAHLRPLEAALDAAGLAHARLAAVERGTGPLPGVVVVDRIGVLADLYRAGEIAYVGGGFHAAGLHSVVEPAALEVPVLFGPRHANAREAAELAGAGGGFVVADEEALAARILALAADEEARREAGAAAVAYVRSQLGGARRNAELVLEVMGRGGTGARRG